MLSLGVVGQAVFVVISLLWLKEMPRRWRSDWENFRDATEASDRIVVGAIWLVTFYLLFSLTQFVWLLVSRFAGA